jgi:regulator of nonsense transcripts 1
MVSSKFDRDVILTISPRHEHLYEEIKNNIIISDRFPKPSALRKTLQGAQVILCTLGMISNPKLQVLAQEVSITNVIIDEASQIEVAQYVPLLNSYGKTLQKMCFVGDDKQCKSVPQ